MDDAGKTLSRIEDDPEIARLLLEYDGALERGGAPDRAAILARRPEAAAELAVCLDGIDFIHGVAPLLRGGPERPLETGSPAVLGDFRIGREIGRGGMGVVYEADQLSLGRRVALKVLPFAAILDPRRLQRFRNEAQAAAHLHHNHIVPVHAVGCERGVHFYAMQLIAGHSIEALIAELRARRHGGGRARSEGDAAMPGLDVLTASGSHESAEFCRAVARLGLQAAQALDYAHQQGVIHRDVKPGNLLVDAQGELWVTDFGLASIQSGATTLTRTGDLVGTLRYMSPELAAAGRLPVDHRSDIYSLGVTLYELLTLEGAIRGDEPGEVLRAIAAEDPTPARRLNRAAPAELETILEKAMAKSPLERYATAREMAEDLQRLLDGRPILAEPPSLAIRAAKWGRRHRGVVAAAFLVLLVGSAALAVGAARLSSEEKKTRAALVKAEANRIAIVESVLDFVRLGDLGVRHTERWAPPKELRPFLERALRLNESAHGSDAARVLNDRATILSALGREKEALEVSRVVANLDRNALSVRNLATAHSRVGQQHEALHAIDEALDLSPDSAAAHYERGLILHRLDRLPEAIQSLRHAIALASGDPAFHIECGNCLVETRQYKEALEEGEQAIALDKDAASAYRLRGCARLDGFDDARGALADFDRAIELGGGDPGCQANRGNAYYRLRYYDLALASYRRAIEGYAAWTQRYVVPHSRARLASLECGCAEALAGLKQFDASIEAYGRALDLDPTPETAAEIYSGRGLVFASRDRAREALADLDIAIEKGFRSAQLFNTAAWIRATHADAGLRDPARAEALAREALSMDPSDGAAFNTLGVALVRRGRWDESLGAFEKSMSLRSGGDAFDWLFLAIAHWHLGHKDEARKRYDQAVDWIAQNRLGDDKDLARFRTEAAALLGVE